MITKVEDLCSFRMTKGVELTNVGVGSEGRPEVK